MNEELELPLTKIEETFRDLVSWAMFDSTFAKKASRRSHLLISGYNKPDAKRVRFEKTHWLKDLENPFGPKIGYIPSIILECDARCIAIVEQVQFEMQDGEFKTSLNELGRIGPSIDLRSIGYIVDDSNYCPFGAIHTLAIEEAVLSHQMIDYHLDNAVPTPSLFQWFYDRRRHHRKQKETPTS